MHPGLDAKKGLEDLFYFAKEICGFKDMSVETHGPICARISARVLDGKRIGIVIPRDHFKSSLGLAMCVWMFTRKAVLENDLGYRIMVDSATLDQSTKHIMWIGRLLRSERYKELYGNFVDRRKGASVAKRQIFASGRDNTHKDPNFAANGIGAEATGGHFELVWHDDLVGEKNWHTPSLRQKAYEHFEATESFLEPTGTKFITATRWHDGDVTGHLIKKEEEAPDHEKDWEFYVRAAIEDGKALFPERWPLERLAMLKGRITAFKWASQYMNDPVIKEFAIPVEATDLYRPIDIFPKRLRLKTVTVDPNFRDEQQSSGDFGCFVVGGFDPFMHWWGLDVRLGFWTASQFIDQMFDIYKVWKPDIIKIERKFTSFLMYAINDRQAQLGVRLPISLIDRDMRSKETRYACLEPLFRSKKIKFSKDIQEKTKREMEDELTRCGSSAHDDFLDALSDQFEQVNPVIGEGQSSETVPLKAKSYSEEGGESPKPAGGWMWGQAELDD